MSEGDPLAAVLTVQEAAHRTGRSVWAIRAAMRRGRLRYRSVGRSRIIDPADLAEYVAEADRRLGRRRT